MKLTGQGRELGKVDWKGSEGGWGGGSNSYRNSGNILDSVVMNIEVAINPAESTTARIGTHRTSRPRRGGAI